jgi:cytochrome c peroxidase
MNLMLPIMLRHWRGRTVLAAASLLLGVGACQSEADQPQPEQFPAPTPYALVLPTKFPTPQAQPADNPLTVEGMELGRHLFYEKALSVDNTKSCGSCHQQAKAFSDGLARAEGVGGAQHPRSAMPLQNLLWEPRLTWDGANSSLEEQARTPIENAVELHQPLGVGVSRLQQLAKYPPLFGKAFGSSIITEEHVLKALAQFERTLISGNSRFDRYNRGERSLLTADEVRGMQLFSIHPNGRLRGGNCSDCHSGELQTDHNFRNNGLDAAFTDLGLGRFSGKPTDNGKFRVPSLRNIALTAPYMHDGRLATLEDVLDHYNEHVQFSSPNIDPLMLNTTNDPAQQSRTLELTAEEKRQIVAFLKTLTDEEFVKDPRFAEPK